jgi:predicted nucleic acid-binding protein
VVKGYADTSFLFPFYVPDANTQRCLVWRKRYPIQLVFTSFHRIELRNALSLACFQKRIDDRKMLAAWELVETDLETGALTYEELDWKKVIARTEEFARVETKAIGTRTLDILHVASAITLGHDHFCTCDLRQSKLAEKAGLTLHLP